MAVGNGLRRAGGFLIPAFLQHWLAGSGQSEIDETFDGRRSSLLSPFLQDMIQEERGNKRWKHLA